LNLKEQNQYNRDISINYYQKPIIPLQEKIIIKKMRLLKKRGQRAEDREQMTENRLPQISLGL
jgi:hypothetical protein